MPALQIVTEAAWCATHDRLADVRSRLLATGAALGNRRARDIESPYLLSGFARCGACGGSFVVMGGSHTSGRPHVYGCLTHHKRGRSVCANGLKLPIDRVDGAVERSFAAGIRPAVVMALVDAPYHHVTSKAGALDVDQKRAVLRAIAGELANLARAIATGG